MRNQLESSAYQQVDNLSAQSDHHLGLVTIYEQRMAACQMTARVAERARKHREAVVIGRASNTSGPPAQERRPLNIFGPAHIRTAPSGS